MSLSFQPPLSIIQDALHRTLTDVDPSWVGRDVFALTRFGGYSDVVIVPQKQAFAKPALALP